jgi:CBS domain-containing protein
MVEAEPLAIETFPRPEFCHIGTANFPILGNEDPCGEDRTNGTVFALCRVMNVENWMRHPVVTVKPHDSVAHAREIMEKHRINQLVVVVGQRVVGIVTDRDLRDASPSVFEAASGRQSSDGRAPERTTAVPISDVMTRNVLSVGRESSMTEAARLMQRERIGAVPVLDGSRLVGILTRSDMLRALVALTDPVLERAAADAGALD